MTTALFIVMGLVFLVLVGGGVLLTALGNADQAAARWGFVGVEGTWVVEPRFSAVRRFSEGLAPVRVGQRWGYIDASGTLKLEATWYDAAPFSDGLARVVDPDTRNHAFIDRAGTRVIPATYFDAGDAAEGVVRVAERVGTQTTQVSGSVSRAIVSWGLLGTDGTTIVAPAGLDDPQRWTETRRPSEGLLAVRIGGSWGFFRTDGTQAIAPRFEDVGAFSDGLAPARQDGAWGYLSADGAWVVPPRFKRAWPFSEGVAAVETSDGFTYIDRDGQTWEQRFERADPFAGGRAVVKQGAWRLVDREGRLTDGAFAKTAGSVDRGVLAAAIREGEGLTATYQWFVANMQGAEVSSLRLVDVDEEGFSEGLLGARGE